jgi:hypothetical protein
MPLFTIIVDVTPLLHEGAAGGRVQSGRVSYLQPMEELFMNRTALAILAVAVIVLSGCTTRDSAMGNTPPALSADDESAVRGIVNEFANTWSRHDMKAMHELDTEDVEWVNVVGHYWRGKRLGS